MDTLNYEKWKALKFKKNLEGEKALEAVKQNGYDLKYVINQTEAICLEAVKQNGDALQYVTNQTEAICLEAVKQDGWALQYVTNQTEAICLEAVKQDGWALRYVEERFFNQGKTMTDKPTDNFSNKLDAAIDDLNLHAKGETKLKTSVMRGCINTEPKRYKWKVEYITDESSNILDSDNEPVGIGFPVKLAERIINMHNDSIDELQGKMND